MAEYFNGVMCEGNFGGDDRSTPEWVPAMEMQDGFAVSDVKHGWWFRTINAGWDGPFETFDEAHEAARNTEADFLSWVEENPYYNEVDAIYMPCAKTAEGWVPTLWVTAEMVVERVTSAWWLKLGGMLRKDGVWRGPFATEEEAKAALNPTA